MSLQTWPTELNARIQYIQMERKQVIQQLALQGRRSGAEVDQNGQYKPLFERLRSLLIWLDSEVQMTPELKEKTQMEAALNTINGDEFHFPKEFKGMATELMQKWQSENWGRSARAIDSPQQGGEESDEEEDVKAGNGSRVTSGGNRPFEIVSPPPNHEIWGRDGIMHGLAFKYFQGGGKSKVLDPALKNRQRSAKVYGHNDITVGRWFPYQLCAVFRGAHGTSQAGITYGPIGAYSVIVSGIYEALDRDLGETIYYSGSGAHDNEDPTRLGRTITAGTRSLHASIDSQQPVRVLRSHSGKSSWAPMKGLRYDGLYKVVSYSTPRNEKGGLYERFKLERIEDGQPPLAECKARPNARDLREYDRIDHGYPRPS